MPWLKLKSFERGDQSSRKHLDDVQSKLNVNEEYLKALRTKSFTDIWNKVHEEQQQQTSITANIDQRVPSSLSPLLPSYTHITDYLLEPRQDILSDMFKASNLHHLLIDFFDGNLEAFRICGLLLQTIERTRSDYRIIQKVIKFTANIPSSSDYTDDQCRLIFSNLASFAKLDNPFSSSDQLPQLNLLRNQCRLTLDRLTISHKSIARRVKLISLCDKIWEVFLIVVCGALAAATLALGLHGLIGIVAAAPSLLSLVNSLMGFFKGSTRSSISRFKRTRLRRTGAQLDAAAKGVFILNQDFGTMSRLVMRLRDEIEHLKEIAGLSLRNRKMQMLKEVVKEFQNHENCFLEQLEELEEHVYLCCLTINRARRLVIQEILLHRTHDQAAS